MLIRASKASLFGSHDCSSVDADGSSDGPAFLHKNLHHVGISCCSLFLVSENMTVMAMAKVGTDAGTFSKTASDACPQQVRTCHSCLGMDWTRRYILSTLAQPAAELSHRRAECRMFHMIEG